jgi:hypothetical protein
LSHADAFEVDGVSHADAFEVDGASHADGFDVDGRSHPSDAGLSQAVSFFWLSQVGCRELVVEVQLFGGGLGFRLVELKNFLN